MPQSSNVALQTTGRRGSNARPKPKVGEGSGISAADLRELLEAQNHRCALTGRELTPQTAAVDLRTPLARGGKHCKSNAHIIHVEADAAKGSLTAEEFLQLCREVVAHTEGPNDGAKEG